MMRIFALCAALVFLVACEEAGPTASRQTSPSGIEYTLIVLPEQEDVTLQIAWPTDWGYRADTNKAAPYVGAQLILAGGAEGYPAGDAGERFADLNSEAALYVALNDHIIGELTFEKASLQDTVEVAAAHIRAPSMEQSWFERVRDGLAQNMADAQAQPSHASFDAARWAVFGSAPLRNSLSLDDPDVFETLSRADVLAWHKETFTRAPDAIVVGGNIDSKTAGDIVDAILANLPDRARPVQKETPIDFTPKRILLHKPDAASSNLAFIAPVPPTKDGAEIEDLILTHALGGDDQSVLFNAVRTELRASYGFSAGIENYTRDHRLLFMNGAVEDAKLAEAEQVVRAAYADFQKAGPQGPLEDRKAPLENNFSTLSDFLVDQARSELQSALDAFPTGRSLAFVDELKEVTDASVTTRLTQAFPTADSFIVIAVSPNADALPGACVITEPKEALACK